MLTRTPFFFLVCGVLTATLMLPMQGCQKNTGPQTMNGITVLAPTEASIDAAKLDYSPYEVLGSDGVLLVPSIDPNFQIVASISNAGDYEISLAQDKCATGVSVEVSKGENAATSVNSLTLEHPKMSVKNVKGEMTKLLVKMQEGAPNNWFCNVMVRKVG